MKKHTKFEQLDQYQKISDLELQDVTGGFNQGAYDAGKKVGKVIKLGGFTYKVIKYGRYLI